MPAWSGLTYQSRSSVKGRGLEAEPVVASPPLPQAERPSASVVEASARAAQRRLAESGSHHVRVTLRASHLTTRCSIRVTRAKRTIAIAPSRVIAANILAVSNWLEEIST